MSYIDTIKSIQNLPHYREIICKKCGHTQKEYILTIQSDCENCGFRRKIRGYAGIGSEIEDVIDVVLDWIGTEDEFKDAMKRKRIFDLEKE